MTALSAANGFDVTDRKSYSGKFCHRHAAETGGNSLDVLWRQRVPSLKIVVEYYTGRVADIVHVDVSSVSSRAPQLNFDSEKTVIY